MLLAVSLAAVHSLFVLTWSASLMVYSLSERLT